VQQIRQTEKIVEARRQVRKNKAKLQHQMPGPRAFLLKGAPEKGNLESRTESKGGHRAAIRAIEQRPKFTVVGRTGPLSLHLSTSRHIYNKQRTTSSRNVVFWELRTSELFLKNMWVIYLGKDPAMGAGTQ
jgi:hypothetical protein